MRAEAHVSIGLLTTAIAANFDIVDHSVGVYAFSVLGSLFNDIDHANSTINNVLLGKFKGKEILRKVIFLLAGVVSLLAGELQVFSSCSGNIQMLGILCLIIALTSHRKITHNYIFVFLLSFALINFNTMFGLAFGISTTLHIACDRISKDNNLLRFIEFGLIGFLFFLLVLIY